MREIVPVCESQPNPIWFWSGWLEHEDVCADPNQVSSELPDAGVLDRLIETSQPKAECLRGISWRDEVMQGDVSPNKLKKLEIENDLEK